MLCPVCQSPVVRVAYRRGCQPVISTLYPDDEPEISELGIAEIACQADADHVFWTRKALVPSGIGSSTASVKRAKHLIDIIDSHGASHVVEVEVDDHEDGRELCDYIAERMDERGCDGEAGVYEGSGTPAIAATVIGQDGETFEAMASRVLAAAGITP